MWYSNIWNGKVGDICVQARHQAFERLTVIFEHVPAVGHLQRSGRAKRCPTGIFGGPVPRNDLHAGMHTKPRSQRFRSPIRQQVNRSMLLKIHKNSPIGSTLLERKIVHTQNPWNGRRR